MTTLGPYRGFQAAVEYDEGILLVRLLHITDSVSTTCDAASDVADAFKELVDDYIETCSEIGEEPDRSFKGSFNIRVEPRLHRDAAMCAASHEMSLNSWIEEAIKEKLDNDRSTYRYVALETELRQTTRGIKERTEEWKQESPTKITDINEYRSLIDSKRNAG